MKLYWSLRMKRLRSGSGSACTARPIDGGDRRTASPRSDSSRPSTITLFIGKSGRNMSMLMFATMASRRHGRMRGEVARAEQALLFGGHRHEQHRALRPLRPLRQRRGRLDQRGDARRVVHRAVVDAVAVDRAADAEVIEMRRQHDVFVAQRRIAAGQHAGDVVRLDRRRLDRHLGAHRGSAAGSAAAPCRSSASASISANVCPEPANSRSACAGLKAIAHLLAGGVVERRHRPATSPAAAAPASSAPRRLGRAADGDARWCRSRRPASAPPSARPPTGSAR